jgi:dTDP-4-dehydrorhamnose reductase
VIDASFPKDRLQLWGGIECTVNRVHDAFFSQLERNGHAARRGDIDRAAGLGITFIRYPVLWERTAPFQVGQADWSWPDQRLARLRELGVTPIVGLVHHGSGPAHTSLIDPEFPSKLAEYAAAVSRRYPWIEYYTPVNEPLTTARFSGLYGAWYPHGRDERTFKDALLSQCRAIVLSMRAIRQTSPEAKLVQTEDLGKTYSTAALAYQAQFNNERRWLVWDLLCGRVNSKHPLWTWLTEHAGADPAELLWFEENHCAPDIIGVNYYVTSERVIDERLENYPSCYHGGNGRQQYADIEAARCLAVPTSGIKPLLHEVWDRYRLPVAITEAHLDATRDDQMRWLYEIWVGAQNARQEGVDVRAVTFWALFGSYDWNCLVTECRGYYEPGAFDVRGPQPRPTAIARMMRELAEGREPKHPVLSGPGWWKRSERFFSPPVTLPSMHHDASSIENDAPPVLITGATGTLGRAFARICKERGLKYRILTRKELDITDADSVDRNMEINRPWAIINAAGYVRVDDAEQDVERCFKENTVGPRTLASMCAKHKVGLVTFSSDLVFDGKQNAPYIETDQTAPLNVYGKSKAEAEKMVLDLDPGALVIRTSAFFGPWDEYNYLTLALRALHEQRAFLAAKDLTVSPTYVPDLVNASLDLAIDGEAGVWHLSNGNAVTWAELALRVAGLANVEANSLQICHSRELGLTAPRPIYSVLGTKRCPQMPSLDDALNRYLSHRQINCAPQARA